MAVVFVVVFVVVVVVHFCRRRRRQLRSVVLQKNFMICQGQMLQLHHETGVAIQKWSDEVLVIRTVA